jgi:hypothetical protein
MYRFQHTLEVLQNIAVPKAQNAIATRLKPSRARLIVSDPVVVLAAVDLDQQAMRQTGEIDDVWADRNLAPKTAAADLTVSQLPPELALGVRQVPSKLPGPSGSHASRLSAMSRAVATPHPTLPLKGGGIWTPPSQVCGYGQELSAV